MAQPNLTAAQRYFDDATRRLAGLLDSQRDALDQAARLCTDAIAADGLVHLFGCGHSRMMCEEMTPRQGCFVLVGPRLVFTGEVAPRRPGDLLGCWPRILRFALVLAGRGLAQLDIVQLPLGRALEGGPGLLDFLENTGADFGVRPLLMAAHPGSLLLRRLPDHLGVGFLGINVEQLVVIDGPPVSGDAEPFLVRVEHDRSPQDVRSTPQTRTVRSIRPLEWINSITASRLLQSSR
jgi:hypothetical protein